MKYKIFWGASSIKLLINHFRSEFGGISQSIYALNQDMSKFDGCVDIASTTSMSEYHAIAAIYLDCCAGSLDG